MDERFDLLSKLVPIGNLDLRRISWSSPAALLEKLIHSDAVREIRSWNPRIESVAYSSRDRSNRLDSRVYITQDRTLVGKAKTIGDARFYLLLEGEINVRALFVLTPAESKRLIGKAVAEMEEVKRAKENGKILIGHGSTNVFVAEEILGKGKVSELWKRDSYLSGVILRGTLCTTLGEEKPPILVLNRGVVEPPAATMDELLSDFGSDSVFIKGANCVDPEGNAAAFMAHPEGGTIGWAIGTIIARGIRLIVPVGLEKLVASVPKAVTLCGQLTFDYCQGLRVGLLPLSGGKVVTEITALKILAGTEAVHVASGGCSGSEGAVTLVAEGEASVVQKAIRMVESIKGETPLMPRKGICLSCVPSSPAQPKGYKFNKSRLRCCHEGKPEEQIPPYLRRR